MFTGLLFYADVGKQQLRIHVFVNFQTCPVPLSTQGSGELICKCHHDVGLLFVLAIFQYNSV